MSAVLEQATLPLIPNLPKCIKRTEVSLEIDGEISFEQWSAAFDTLDKTKRGVQWQIGDMLNDGEMRFGDDCYQVIDPIEEEQRDDDGRGETYRSYQWVSQRIPAVHRCTDVPWSLHRDVAALDAPERDYWLGRASAEKLSRRKLQKAMQTQKDQEQKDREHVAEHVRSLQQKAMIIHCDESMHFQRQLKEKCPIPKIGDRLYNSIIEELEDIKANIQTANIESALQNAVMQGYETIQDLSGFTGLNQNDVRRVIKQMVDKGMLETRSVEESRQDGRRGVMVDIYALHPDYLQKLGD